MRDQLGVAVRAENVAFRFELGLHFRIVEEFAVEDGDDGAIFVVDRLFAVREPDDAEPAIGEPDAGFFEIAVLIRPAMGDGVGHAFEDAGRDRADEPERSMMPAMPHIFCPYGIGRLMTTATEPYSTPTSARISCSMSSSLPSLLVQRPFGNCAA